MLKSYKNVFLGSDHPNLEDVGSPQKKTHKGFM